MNHSNDRSLLTQVTKENVLDIVVDNREVSDSQVAERSRKLSPPQ